MLNKISNTQAMRITLIAIAFMILILALMGKEPRITEVLICFGLLFATILLELIDAIRESRPNILIDKSVFEALAEWCKEKQDKEQKLH